MNVLHFPELYCVDIFPLGGGRERCRTWIGEL